MNYLGFKIYYFAGENIIKWDVDLHCRLYNIEKKKKWIAIGPY